MTDLGPPNVWGHFTSIDPGASIHIYIYIYLYSKDYSPLDAGDGLRRLLGLGATQFQLLAVLPNL